MASARKQAQIDAAPKRVWELIANVERHPEWWPRIVEVECEGIEQGCTYRRVFQTPLGRDDTTFVIDQLDDCKCLKVRCLDSGSYASFTLAEARGGTFVDAEVGLDPIRGRDKVFNALMAKRFYRHWLDETLDSLRRAACEPAPSLEHA